MVLSATMTGFIASQIARLNRNVALIFLGLGLIAGWITWFGWTYVSAVLLGPRQVGIEELASPRFQSDANNYKAVLAVQGDSAGPIFYSGRQRRGKGYGTAYCWLVKAGGKQLIVESWDASPTPRAAGMLITVRGEFYRWAVAKFPGQEILPVFLDERDWKSQGWTIFGFAAAFGTGALMAGAVLAYWNMSAERHPVRRAVSRLGDFDSIAMQIDGDMQAGERFGSAALARVFLGPCMLAYTQVFSFDVVRVSDIADASTQWVREGRGRALYLKMRTRDLREVKWQISPKGTDRLLERIRSAAHVGPALTKTEPTTEG